MASKQVSDSTFGIAKLVGEGFGRPHAVDDTPIDIQYGKLAEWLVRVSTLVCEALRCGQCHNELFAGDEKAFAS